jgi:hypothetical protein
VTDSAAAALARRIAVASGASRASAAASVPVKGVAGTYGVDDIRHPPAGNRLHRRAALPQRTAVRPERDHTARTPRAISRCAASSGGRIDRHASDGAKLGFVGVITSRAPAARPAARAPVPGSAGW